MSQFESIIIGWLSVFVPLAGLLLTIYFKLVAKQKEIFESHLKLNRERIDFLKDQLSQLSITNHTLEEKRKEAIEAKDKRREEDIVTLQKISGSLAKIIRSETLQSRFSFIEPDEEEIKLREEIEKIWQPK